MEKILVMIIIRTMEIKNNSKSTEYTEKHSNE